MYILFELIDEKCVSKLKRLIKRWIIAQAISKWWVM